MTEYGWHSLPADYRLGNNDNRIVELGVPVTYEGNLKACSTGLHACPNPVNMIEYIKGPIICYVKCEGITERYSELLVCNKRTVLWWSDCTDLLLDFAYWGVLSFSHLWSMPDVVRRYLDGTERNKELLTVAYNVLKSDYKAIAKDQNKQLEKLLIWFTSLLFSENQSWAIAKDIVHYSICLADSIHIQKIAEFDSSKVVLSKYNIKLLDMLKSKGWKEVMT